MIVVRAGPTSVLVASVAVTTSLPATVPSVQPEKVAVPPAATAERPPLQASDVPESVIVSPAPVPPVTWWPPASSTHTVSDGTVPPAPTVPAGSSKARAAGGPAGGGVPPVPVPVPGAPVPGAPVPGMPVPGVPVPPNATVSVVDAGVSPWPAGPAPVAESRRLPVPPCGRQSRNVAIPATAATRSLPQRTPWTATGAVLPGPAVTWLPWPSSTATSRAWTDAPWRTRPGGARKARATPRPGSVVIVVTAGDRPGSAGAAARTTWFPAAAGRPHPRKVARPPSAGTVSSAQEAPSIVTASVLPGPDEISLPYVSSTATSSAPTDAPGGTDPGSAWNARRAGGPSDTVNVAVAGSRPVSPGVASVAVST